MDEDSDVEAASPRRQPENLVACKKAVMRLMALPMPHAVGPGVTAGWLENRGIGFTEYTILTALRSLMAERKIVRATDGGLVYWQILTPEVEEQIKKRKARFGARKAT